MDAKKPNCLECEYWEQLPDNGDDICLATKDANGMCNVISPNEITPEWCPMRQTKE